jgi:hypothetical protein
VNGWINEFPDAERVEMVARMKDSDSSYYQAALAEVMMHAALAEAWPQGRDSSGIAAPDPQAGLPHQD